MTRPLELCWYSKRIGGVEDFKALIGEVLKKYGAHQASTLTLLKLILSLNTLTKIFVRIQMEASYGWTGWSGINIDAAFGDFWRMVA